MYEHIIVRKKKVKSTVLLKIDTSNHRSSSETLVFIFDLPPTHFLIPKRFSLANAQESILKLSWLNIFYFYMISKNTSMIIILQMRCEKYWRKNTWKYYLVSIGNYIFAGIITKKLWKLKMFHLIDNEITFL